MKVEDLIHKEISTLSLYRVDGACDMQSDSGATKLDLNENFVVESEVMKKLLFDACRNIDVRLYPSPYGGLAAKALSGFLGFDESEISVGNGADEILDLLAKVFVAEGSKVLIVEPTFSMYTYYTCLYGGKKVTALLTPSFELDVEQVLRKADEGTSLLFLCSPNNPTGNQLKKDAIEKILENLKGIVIADETYVNFAKQTVIDLIRDFDNLVVVRTFSKGFGLAGIRFGFLVSNKRIVEYVKKVTSPFNVNIFTQSLISLALQNWKYFEQRIQLVIKERNWLTEQLNGLEGVTVYPSDANFILFKVARKDLSSATVTRKLYSKNILVKDRGDLPLLANCVRVTVGTRGMNEAFVSGVREVLEENSNA
jgi:histidinol-phosphate aminotransferase